MSADNILVQALMWLASVFAFAVVAAGAYFVMATLTDRNRVAHRMSLALGAMRESRTERRGTGSAADLKSSVGNTVAALGRLMPLGEEDRQKIAVSLQRAGYRSSNGLAIMLGTKFACLVTGLVFGIVMLTATFPGILGIFAGLIGGVLAGVLLNVVPEMVLGRLATVRLRRIDAGLAETFDLLVVCLESGLTFDRALKRTVENLKSFQPDLAKEFGQAVLDMSVHGRTREDALGRLAGRLDGQNFRDLATTVAQSERHGTPLADALRKLASSVRVEAISRMQERMARLPTLLIVPSIACVLPGIMVIIGGPAFIQLTQSLSDFGGG